MRSFFTKMVAFVLAIATTVLIFGGVLVYAEPEDSLASISEEEMTESYNQGVVVSPNVEEQEPAVLLEPDGQGTVEITETFDKEIPVQLKTTVENEIETPSIVYSGHVQTYGWLNEVKDGNLMGTTGEAKRMEALQIHLENAENYPGSGISYSAHVQTYGWMDLVNSGSICGTTGEAKRMEAVTIELTGPIADAYDIYYCVHVQSYGWLKWAKNGDIAGTSGLFKRVEAICIQIVPKGEAAPVELGSCSYAYLPAVWAQYTSHMQSYGWLHSVSDGRVSGVTGESKRMEAIKIVLQNAEAFTDSDIRYRGHVQGIGWQDYVFDGTVAGTIGQSKRMEAIQIQLTGSIADYYDVYYSSYVQHLGWLGWAKNGAISGTTGSQLRLEAIVIKILPKGAAAPGNLGNIANSYYENLASAQAFIVLNQIGWNLQAAFRWSVGLSYQAITQRSAAPGTRWYANYGFTNHRGNCFVYAATFCEMAQLLGYDAHQIAGSVPLGSGGYGPHSWVEIKVGDITYVCDPDFTYETGYNGYMIRYGQSGTWRYVRDTVMH